MFPVEASVRNFGQVIPSGFSPGKWHEYGRYSTALYKALQDKIDIGIINNGSTYIANDVEEFELLDELKNEFSNTGYESIILSKEDLIQKFPQLNSNYPIGGLFFPQEVSADPLVLIHQLHKFLKESLSVEFKYASPIIDISDNGCEVKLITTSKEKIVASKAIVCNGHEFRLLFPELYSSSAIEICKLNMMVTKPLPQIRLQGNILTNLTIRRYESFKALTSYQNLKWEHINKEVLNYDVHILFKQKKDGSIIIGDSHEYADVNKKEELGFDIDMKINKIILKEVRKMLPINESEISSYWCGFYAQMKSNEEILDLSYTQNIKIVTAIGGKGMTAAAGYSKDSIDSFF